MKTRSQFPVSVRSARRAQIMLVGAAVASLAIVLAFAGIIVLDALQGGHSVRALIVGTLALLAIALWLRILWTQWFLLRAHQAPASADLDDSGIWGIGGPNVRTPGATGIFRMRESRGRRTEDRGDESD